MTLVLVVAAAVLGVAAMLVTARVVMGPTMLDRAISFDVIVAITIAGISVDAALRRTSENLPLMLVATLLGFVGSVSIARFSPGSDDVEESDSDSESDSESDDDAGSEVRS